jgi:hypothetical protein
MKPKKQDGSVSDDLLLLEPVGYIPPAEAEANYYQQLEEKAR